MKIKFLPADKLERGFLLILILFGVIFLAIATLTPYMT